MVDNEHGPPPASPEKVFSDLKEEYTEPQDGQEYLARELILQAEHKINPCGAKFWDPKWDEPDRD